MNTTNLFSISLLSIPVNDWEEKKKKILLQEIASELDFDVMFMLEISKC